LKCLELLWLGVCRLRQHRHPASPGHRLNHYVLPLAVKLGRQKADASDVAVRTSKRFNQPSRNHVSGEADNRNGGHRLLCGAHMGHCGTENDIWWGFRHRRHDFGELLVTQTKAAAINLQILSVYEAEHAELVKKCGVNQPHLRPGTQNLKAIAANRLLRAHRERPRRRTA
jgi:hypothetical protein